MKLRSNLPYVKYDEWPSIHFGAGVMERTPVVLVDLVVAVLVHVHRGVRTARPSVEHRLAVGPVPVLVHVEGIDRRPGLQDLDVGSHAARDDPPVRICCAARSAEDGIDARQLVGVVSGGEIGGPAQARRGPPFSTRALELNSSPLFFMLPMLVVRKFDRLVPAATGTVKIRSLVFLV